MGFADRAVAEYAIADSATKLFISQSIAENKTTIDMQLSSVVRSINKNLTSNDNNTLSRELELQIINKNNSQNKSDFAVPIKAISKAITKNHTSITTDEKEQAKNISVTVGTTDSTVELDLSSTEKTLIVGAVKDLYGWKNFDVLNEDNYETVIDEEYNT